MNNRRLEVSVVAARLNVAPCTVYRLIKAKELVATRSGVKKGFRVHEQSLEEFEKKRAVVQESL